MIDERAPKLDAYRMKRVTITTVPTCFETVADPLAPILTGSTDMATAIARIENQVGRGR